MRVHRGTGAGIISNGRILLAATATSVKLAISRSNLLGERCHRGNFGCLETIAANAAIEQRVLNLLKQGYQEPRAAGRLHHKTICKAANKGDSLASESD
ncbi:ROK family protein [Escherichia coli]|nr:ROK family protein [Escherichia coli]